MGDKEDTADLKTTSQSLGILEYIEREGGSTMKEISKEFNLPKSTAHNHLSTLKNRGYLAKSGDRYVLGMKLLRLAEAAQTRDEMYLMARDKMKELARDMGEGADFCILENGNVYAVFNEVINKKDPHFGMGKRFGIHTSAAAKAILSACPKNQVDDILEGYEFEKITENTITSETAYREELRRVKERGYATTDEEYQKGLRGVGAPIMLPNGRPLGSLNVGGPTYRFSGEYFTQELPNRVMAAASEIENEITSRYSLASK